MLYKLATLVLIYWASNYLFSKVLDHVIGRR